MANYSIVPNTTSTCNSMESCVNRMCELSHANNVDMVCFMSDGSSIPMNNIITPLLTATSVVLFVYSVVITWLFYHHTTKNNLQTYY